MWWEQSPKKLLTTSMETGQIIESQTFDAVQGQRIVETERYLLQINPVSQAFSTIASEESGAQTLFSTPKEYIWGALKAKKMQSELVLQKSKSFIRSLHQFIRRSTMKKIPTLFEREFKNGKLVGITPSVLPEFEWVFEGEGVATTKFDGACCAVIDGEFYKRYDAKRGKTPPAGAIPCCEPDHITGHWPHWVKVDWSSPADKWFVDAYITRGNGAQVEDGTYEAIGRMFQGNPYNIGNNVLVRHGSVTLDLPELSFPGIREFLCEHPIEGIVWWKDGEPQCKIKRTDFGFAWPIDRRDNLV